MLHNLLFFWVKRLLSCYKLNLFKFDQIYREKYRHLGIKSLSLDISQRIFSQCIFSELNIFTVYIHEVVGDKFIIAGPPPEGVTSRAIGRRSRFG
jgi:hypothetical protein